MGAGEICILAGGLSSRMGRDKSKLRLGGKTLLRRAREAASQTAWPVRVIRRDLVERCGPLGGVYTALYTTTAERILFLACDMPFVTPALLQDFINLRPSKSGAIFSSAGGDKVGFPFILRRDLLPKVERMLAQKIFSMQALAKRCRAKVAPAFSDETVLFNVNTPGDWQAARRGFRGTVRAKSAL